MSMPVSKPATTPIPVQLFENEFKWANRAIGGQGKRI
jgi:hypothetical protein